MYKNCSRCRILENYTPHFHYRAVVVFAAGLQRPKQVHLAQGEWWGYGEAGLVDFSNLHFNQLGLEPLAEAAGVSYLLGKLPASDGEHDSQRLPVSRGRIEMMNSPTMCLQHDCIGNWRVPVHNWPAKRDRAKIKQDQFFFL